MEKIRFRGYEAIRLQHDDPDFEEMLSCALVICDEYLGEGLYPETRLRDICKRDNHFFYCVMKDGLMAGIFYCFAERFEKTDLFGLIDVSYLSADVRVGVAQSIALKREARGQEVAEWLLDHGTRLLLQLEEVETVLVPAWMKDRVIPASTHLEKCGYRILQVVEHPWASYGELRCPVCGTVPCSCDGVIYIKRASDAMRGGAR